MYKDVLKKKREKKELSLLTNSFPVFEKRREK